ADAPDRRRDVLDLGVTGPVRAGAPHRPPEVEREHDEPARRELVAQRPQDRVVLAPAVTRVRVADHGRARRRRLGAPQLALERHAVLRPEPQWFHAWDDARRDDATTTERNRLRAARPVALAGALPDRARRRTRRL